MLRRVGVVLGVAAAPLWGQMHKVAKPETVVRAVGVYEWTGEMAKPTASRLIPVTLYIDMHLEDAGVYLARPVPFALDSGDIYELEEAGVPKGTLDLVYARHLQATNVAEAYDDGWFGYGTFHGPVAPKKPVIRKLPPARTSGITGTSGIETASTEVDPDKPHFTNKAGQPVRPASAGSDATKPDASPAPADAADASKKDDTAAGATDPDRPHLTRRADASASSDGTKDKGDAGDKGQASPDGSGTTPAGDPDRPTMKRRNGNDTAGSGAGSEATPTDDPDRPTLKRHSVEDAKKNVKAHEEASVTGTESLNTDPDRPNLHRGKPAHALTEADLPKLSGLPATLRQMVAVSDAANRPTHDFARAWEDDAERLAVLGKMQAMAQEQLAMYGGPAAAAAAAPAKGAAARPGGSSSASGSSSKLRRPLQPLRVALAPLLEEQLKGYLLSYGDVPTFVYQAHTAGDGASLRYVTIVAQRNAQGEPKMVLHAVTDATHLDRTARLRLVDAVDVDASNRASLLFEMRGQTSRQFGVYRVFGLNAEQIFSTGTMQ